MPIAYRKRPQTTLGPAALQIAGDASSQARVDAQKTFMGTMLWSVQTTTRVSSQIDMTIYEPQATVGSQRASEDEMGDWREIVSTDNRHAGAVFAILHFQPHMPQKSRNAWLMFLQSYEIVSPNAGHAVREWSVSQTDATGTYMAQYARKQNKAGDSEIVQLNKQYTHARQVKDPIRLEIKVNRSDSSAVKSRGDGWFKQIDIVEDLEAWEANQQTLFVGTKVDKKLADITAQFVWPKSDPFAHASTRALDAPQEAAELQGIV